jgi:hypothetical protein
MAQAQQYTFTYTELVELMLRAQGITSGIWSLYVKFGLAAANVGPSPESLQPAAILPILELGIQRAEELTSIAVDAGALERSADKRPTPTKTKAPPRAAAKKPASTRR